ncbi:MAG: hypothetical protein ACRCYP_07835 [Alphaproteobacteria bacterium]
MKLGKINYIKVFSIYLAVTAAYSGKEDQFVIGLREDGSFSMQSTKPLTEKESKALMGPTEERTEAYLQYKRLKKFRKEQTQELPKPASLRQCKRTSQEALEPTDPGIKREERAILNFGLNLPTDGPENEANYTMVLEVFKFFEALGPRGQERAQQIRDKLREDLYSSFGKS